jgi:hypothetical protein
MGARHQRFGPSSEGLAAKWVNAYPLAFGPDEAMAKRMDKRI